MSSDERRETDDLILEPFTAYKTEYESKFRQNCEEYFDGLVGRSGIDPEENRRTVASYRAQNRLIEQISGLLSRYRGLKGLHIFLIVLGAVLLAAGIFLLVRGENLTGAVLLAVGVLFVVLFPVLLAKVILPRLRQNEEKRQKMQAKADEILRKAWEQMAPLNALFEGNVTKKLIHKTVPLLFLDDNFNVRRYDYLNGKYGYGRDDDPETSTVGILTGEIVGNPFVVDRTLVHTLGTYTYTGSIEIFWTTTHTDSEGHLVTEHHSQTLTASVTKPKPYYSERTRLIYGNEAAPDLHFSRRPAHVEDLSEKERERKIKKGTKAIRKKQAETVGGAGAFTEMGNEEFDVLFGALDRDNEVQFRLLFTPLAQKNLLALLTDEEGYGDDFEMTKAGCLNYIRSEHSAKWDMEEDRSRYFSFSLDDSRAKFLDFNGQYFRSLYFDLAPLLSIPLYQQHKPHEYIYRESYPRYFTRQETEYAVNSLGAAAFAHPSAATQSILKTNFLSRDGKSDRVRVTANAYRAVDRVDLVPVFGGDGQMHEVPVNWVEYLPVSNTKVVKMKEIGLSDRDFFAAAESGEYRSAIAKHGGEKYGYRHGILCCIVPEEDTAFDADFTLR